MQRSVEWIEWKKKRKKTLIGFVITGAVVGIDYSVVLATLYLYLKDIVKTENPYLYYGVITALFSVSSFIGGVCAGRWVDATRRIRTYLNVIFILQIVGSLLYTIPYSVIFPLIGRLFVGVGDPFVNVCSGEVLRIYDTKGGVKALWWIASTYSIGFVVGPAVNLAFKGIEFHIGRFHVTYLNFVGMFMACLLIVSLLVNNLLIYDCSKQLDLKEYLKQRSFTEEFEGIGELHLNEKTPLLSENSNTINGDVSDVPLSHVLKAYWSSSDICLMFASTFFFMYVLFSSDVLLPLICLETFNWGINSLIYIFFIYGGGYFLVLLLMSRISGTPSHVFSSSLLCIVSQILQLAVLMCISLFSRNEVWDIVLMGMFLVFWSFSWCLEEVLLRSMTSRMVPSSIQSFTEATRSGIARISTIFAALTAPLLTPYLHWWAGVLVIVTLIILLCFLVRRRRLIDPVEIVIGRREIRVTESVFSTVEERA